MRKLVVILGIPVDDLDIAETLDRLEEFVIAGRVNRMSHQVVTVNADFIVKAIGDPELRTILQEAHLATADGMPLVWGARLLGVSLKDRVAGSDFVPALAGRAAQKGFSIFLLGASPQVAAKAAEILQQRNPGLKIAGVISPPVSSILDMDKSIIDEIKAAKPDILLVAFGNPKQEKWIGMYGRQLQVPVMIGVGGTLDFIAGNLRRAPGWMQQAGLEWLFRLLQEPRRLWRRYVVDLFVFTTFFVRQWIAMRRMRPQPLLIPTTDLVVYNDTAIINLQGSLAIENLGVFQKVAEEAISETPFVMINLAKADFLDSSAIGALVGLARQARDAGGELFLTAVPPKIHHTLSLLHLDDFFIVFDNIDTCMAAQSSFRPAVPTPPQSSEMAPLIRIKGIEWSVIRAPRRLDAFSAADFTDLVTAHLVQNPFLILDLEATVFLASAGLAALVHINRLARQKNGEMRVIHCRKDVLRVIELGRFDKVIKVFQELPAAIS